MNGYEDTGDMQDETGPGLILTATGQRHELRTAAHALTLAARRVQAVLIHAPGDRAALDKALGDVDAQRGIISGLLAAEVNDAR